MTKIEICVTVKIKSGNGILFMLAVLLVVPFGMFVSAEEKPEPYAVACTFEGTYSGIQQYWDYDQFWDYRNCVYGEGVTKDYCISKYREVRCNKCNDLYSRQEVSRMWYCPVRGAFY